MNGEVTLYTALKNDTNVTSLLSASGAYPKIAIGVKEPDTWGQADSTISIYNSTGMDNRDKRMIVELTCNCRGATENIVKQIAGAVVTSVNRKPTTGGIGRYYVQTGAVIAPQDDADSYNIPVSVTIKAGEVQN